MDSSNKVDDNEEIEDETEPLCGDDEIYDKDEEQCISKNAFTNMKPLAQPVLMGTIRLDLI